MDPAGANSHHRRHKWLPDLRRAGGRFGGHHTRRGQQHDHAFGWRNRRDTDIAVNCRDRASLSSPTGNHASRPPSDRQDHAHPPRGLCRGDRCPVRAVLKALLCPSAPALHREKTYESHDFGLPHFCGPPFPKQRARSINVDFFCSLGNCAATRATGFFAAYGHTCTPRNWTEFEFWPKHGRCTRPPCECQRTDPATWPTGERVRTSLCHTRQPVQRRPGQTLERRCADLIQRGCYR